MLGDNPLSSTIGKSLSVKSGRLFFLLTFQSHTDEISTRIDDDGLLTKLSFATHYDNSLNHHAIFDYKDRQLTHIRWHNRTVPTITDPLTITSTNRNSRITEFAMAKPVKKPLLLFNYIWEGNNITEEHFEDHLL